MATKVNINIALEGLSKVIDGFEGLEKQTVKLGKSLEKVGNAGVAFGKSMTKNVTLPLAAAGVAAGKLSSDFETAFSRIEGLVGIANEDIGELRDGVLRLAGETAKAPQELADAMFTITSAGFRGAEALDVLESAAKASAAGLGETRAVAEALTGAVNAYGPAALSAARATEIITATARAGNFATEDLAGALGRVTPFAQAAQVSFDDVGGSIALLTRVNNDANESITQVSSLLRAFSAPTKQTIAGLKELGLTTTQLRDSMGQNGLVATLKMLDEKLEGNRDALREIIPDSQGFSAALTILNADADVLAGTFDVVANSVGIVDEAFGAAADTSGFAFDQALSALKTSLITLGDQILPVVVPFVQALTGALINATAAFSALTPEVQRTAILIAAAFGAAGPVIIALGLTIKTFGILIRVIGPQFAIAGKMVVSTIRMIGVSFAAMAGPAGWIALAIAAIILMIGAWERWSTEITNVVNAALFGLGGLFNSFKEKTVLVWTNITDGIKRVFVEPLVAIFNKVGELLSVVGGWFVNLAEAVGINTGNIRDFVTGAFDDIEVKVRDSVATTVDFTMKAYEGLSDGVGAVTGEVVETFQVGWSTISDTVGGYVTNMVDTTTTDIDQMGIDLETSFIELRNTTLALTGEMTDGVTGEVVDMATTVGETVGEMTSSTGVQMTAWGEKINGLAESAANGWLDNIEILSGDTKLTLNDLFEVTLDDSATWVDSMGGLFSGFFDWIGGAFKGLGGLLSGAGSAISSALGLGGGAAAAGAGGAAAGAGAAGASGLGGIAPFAAAFAGVAGLLNLFSGGARDIDPELLKIKFSSLARGTDSVFSSPQLIQVGENGSERVSVTPLSGSQRGAGGGTTIVMQGPTVLDGLSMKQFERRVARANRQTGAAY